jgi:peroxiredoxin Q/BCP
MKTIRHLCCWISSAALALAALPLAAVPSLAVGELAPHFSGHDQDGCKWNLSRYTGKRYVLVYFFPADDTIGGTTEASGLNDNLFEFKQAGVEVVGVSSENRKSQRHFSFKNNVAFPLLADTRRRIADAYGARMDGNGKLDRRISFLIGLDGRILRINKSPDPAGQLKEMAIAVAQLSRKDSL